MLTELIQAATIIDSVVSERMKVYEASFKFEVKKIGRASCRERV